MTTVNPSDYTITVRRRTVEGETVFEASVAELPDVRDYGDSFAEAYELAVETIAALAEEAELDGRAFPAPLPNADQDYSGRVTLRLPKTIHRQAAQIATAQGVSFNSYLCAVIACDVARMNTAATLMANCKAAIDQAFSLAAEKHIVQVAGSWSTAPAVSAVDSDFVFDCTDETANEGAVDAMWNAASRSLTVFSFSSSGRVREFSGWGGAPRRVEGSSDVAAL